MMALQGLTRDPLKDIGEQFGVHYSTVSLAVKEEEGS